ncbi:hypothetical protein ASA1KI_28160 [Opitutales bacterium ASA1]|uniref:hypothetical protein n=1 Tax=Congregicoccus parvus TaxID=3081749 RepID=UPI002B30239C|nr:hypothetical protein ASA1KI_28160 [Opitutales bacterium ASA1]
MKHPVTRAYTSEFEVAPRASEGDVVQFDAYYANNPRWFYGRDSRGVAGYFPVDWFEIDGSVAVARRAYDATELTVSLGREVSIVEQYGGWLLVTDGVATGWIPEESIA